MSEVTADIQNTADELRLRFRDAKRDQLGKPYRPASRHDNSDLWLRAAEECLKHSANPSDWVKSAFRHCSVPGGPFPNMLAGKAIGRWWKEDSIVRQAGGYEQSVDEVEFEVMLEIRSFLEMVVFQQKPAHYFLRDSGFTSIPAWLRVIMAPTDEIIIKRFGRDAHNQVSCNPRLIEVLKERGYSLDWMTKI